MTWWHYLILVNFYLVLFFGFYALLLRKETFFQLNRVYLVAAAILSFCIPVIQADWVRNLFITQKVQRTIYSGTMDAVYNFTIRPSVSAQSSITLGQIFFAVYIAVTVFLVLRFVRQLFILKKSIDSPAPSAAYAFFKKISLGENISQSSVIAEHEGVHAQQWHSLDVMIIEAVMIINWFNPVVYLYRFAIKYIHEYIADRQVIEKGTDKVDYALLLLSQTFETDTHKLVTPFYNHSLLKQRIKMLQKNKSHRIMLAKYGLSAPLFILMLMLSSATVSNSRAINVLNKRTDKALLMPAANVMTIITNRSEIPAENKVQPDEPKTETNSTANTLKADTIPDKVFSMVDKQPQFPGGFDAFAKFLGDNIHYPKVDKDNKIEGRAIVTFVVEKDGTLSNIEAIRGPSETIKKEAVDVLMRSPKWAPGYQNGHAVRVAYTVPINFQLPINDGEKIYNQVAVQPTFPGGLQAFAQFLSNNIRFPKEDRENGVSGKVIVTFVVEKDGSLTNLNAVRGPSERMKAESIRVLSLSPKWTPGKSENGQPVRVSYTVPIAFVLGEANEDAPKPKTGIKLDSLVKSVSPGPNQPLYIIDGVKDKTIDDVKQIKQGDIISVEVLKDATATKLYGDRGVWGVVIITTKKSQKSN